MFMYTSQGQFGKDFYDMFKYLMGVRADNLLEPLPDQMFCESDVPQDT